jgi:hypothetical protein
MAVDRQQHKGEQVMTSKPVRPSLLPDLSAALTTAEDKPARKSTPAFDDGVMRTSLYLPRAVHDVLREIAFHERLKIHDLLREGIDEVLRNRHYPSFDELARKSRPEQ